MSRDMIYYTGSELKWSTEDVYRNAEEGEYEIKSIEDAIAILTAAIQDNEYIMKTINEAIEDEIEEFYRKK